jgi:pimeloyl-ACP methyl ester carboxylesterase
MKTRRLVGALLAGVLSVTAVGPATARAATATTAASHVEGALADGSTYVIDVPAHWNGTVVLYSHGYTPDGAPNPATNAPSDAVRTALLDAGYAQIGSSYPETGWVVERALPAQLATLEVFRDRFGTPRRTIAWGTSMGGMITTGLAERYGQRFAGTLAMCGLEQGAVANFNNTLDPLFALRTLLTPGAGTPLVALPDQPAAFASIGPLTAALEAAQATPQGRARIALAAALHNIPAWTDPARPEPAAGDYDTAELNQFGVLHLTIYVGLSWRQEAEEHAGGNMSWNIGVDYARLLARSSIRAEVDALYARAGLSLSADLAALDAAPRISAEPAAVGYMIRNISFSGRLTRPMLTIHTTGDPLVPVQVEHAYADAVDDAHRSVLLRQAFVHRAGHCTFTTGEMLAAFHALDRRISTGHWPDTGPEELNRVASQLDTSATPAYVHYRPAPYPRPFNLTR